MTGAISDATPGQCAPKRWRVSAVRAEIPLCFTLALAGEGLDWHPGQFNMLYGFGAGERAISISRGSLDGRSLEHTIRIAGDGTRVLSRLRPGDHVGVRGPFGVGWPLASAGGADVLLVAGGLGLAPLRPAIDALLANRDRYGRIVVLYGTRSPDLILYRAELEAWRARFDLTVEVAVDTADPRWHGPVGVVTKLIERASFDADDTIAFVCGPEIMMRFAARALLERGVAANRIHASLERNMKCADALCGHCQLGPILVCRDGPVLSWARVGRLMEIREL